MIRECEFCHELFDAKQNQTACWKETCRDLLKERQRLHNIELLKSYNKVYKGLKREHRQTKHHERLCRKCKRPCTPNYFWCPECFAEKARRWTGIDERLIYHT